MKQLFTRTIRSFFFLFALAFPILVQGADGSFVNGLAVITMNNQYGYIDKMGKWVIEPIFDEAYDFSQGLAIVKTRRQYGFIDKLGNWIIEPRFKKVSNFSDGLALVKIYRNGEHIRCEVKRGSLGNVDWDSAVLIDKAGKEVTTLGCGINFDYLLPLDDKQHHLLLNKGGFHDGLAKKYSYLESQWGVMDTSGQFVVQPTFKVMANFSEGLAAAGNDGGIGYVDKSGKWVIEPKFLLAGNFIEGLANVMMENDKHGFIDKSGNWVIEPKFNYNYSPNFSEGLVRVQTQGNRSKIGFMDKHGKMVIAPAFFEINDFHEGLAAFQEDNRWGYIDSTGKVVIKPKFSTAGDFSEGLAGVRDDKGFGYIDKSGKWAISPAALEKNLHLCKNIKCTGKPNPNTSGVFVGV